MLSTLGREGEDVVVRVRNVEGPRVAVESVEIEGVPADRAAALRARLETRPTGWLRRDVYRADAVERDVRALAAVLAAEGFARARVGPPAVTFSEDRTRARITIPVVEGPRLTVGRGGGHDPAEGDPGPAGRGPHPQAGAPRCRSKITSPGWRRVKG